MHTDVRPHADAYELPGGHRLLLAEGRVVNVVADGHPPEVMGPRVRHRGPGAGPAGRQQGKLPPGVYPGSSDIDAEAARPRPHGTRLYTLTGAQRAYLVSWHLGS
ncbi:MAG: hypothetical protein ACLPKE_13455 [Streptosporangiaceae bacterium]